MLASTLFTVAMLGAASILIATTGYYYRRRRTYNPFSFSITSCCKYVIVAVAGIVVVLLATGTVKGQDVWTLIIVCIVVGVILAVLYLVLKFGKKKTTSSKSSKSSSRSRSSSDSRYRSRGTPQAPRYSSKDAEAEDDEEDAEARRYAAAPSSTSTSSAKSLFVPREDVEPGPDAQKKTRSSRKKKSGFFDGAEEPAEPAGQAEIQPTETTAAAPKKCPKCGKDVVATAKFCMECGSPM
ncbi:MAG: zinc ribbon domain-containing protein [Candidatus Lokiarchaeota archaeon]|nr:zinc ribbon domain-containing protein [Candidatus Lokiarchaeota archaeon]